MICPLGYCNNPDCPKKALCTSQQRAYQSRAILAQKEAIAQKRKDLNQEFRGQYLGYNSQTGLHTVQLTNGGKITCKSITNGFIPNGHQVAGIMPNKGSYGIINNTAY